MMSPFEEGFEVPEDVTVGCHQVVWQLPTLQQELILYRATGATCRDVRTCFKLPTPTISLYIYY